MIDLNLKRECKEQYIHQDKVIAKWLERSNLKEKHKHNHNSIQFRLRYIPVTVLLIHDFHHYLNN